MECLINCRQIICTLERILQTLVLLNSIRFSHLFFSLREANPFEKMGNLKKTLLSFIENPFFGIRGIVPQRVFRSSKEFEKGETEWTC